LVPKDHQYEMAYAESNSHMRPMTSRDPKRSSHGTTRLEPNISKTAGDAI